MTKRYLLLLLLLFMVSFVGSYSISRYFISKHSSLPQDTVVPEQESQILGWTTNCNYIGATGGSWETTSNWDCDGTNRLPTSGDRATIDANVTVNLNATTTVDDLVLGDVSATYSPVLNFNYDAITNGALIIDESDLYVYSGATITHSEGTSAIVGRINIDVQTGNATIAGSINVKAKGYAASQGTGQGSDGNGAGGAGYGGQGGNDGYANTPGGIIYGSLTAPTDLGSGGGIDVVGAKGGGSVKLTVAGTTTLSGNINADGQDNPGTGSNDAGGGSGGSIYITAGTLSGSGTLSVNGTNGYRYGGAGAGGRIAVYYTTDSSTWSFTAYGGALGGSGGNIAASGTIYKEASGGTKAVILNNTNRNPGAKYTTIPNGTIITSLTVSNSAYYYSNSALTVTTFNLTDSGIFLCDSSCNITYTTFNWATSGVFYDRGGTFALISSGNDLTVPASTYLYADTARSYTNVTINGTVTNTANSTTQTYVIRHTVTGSGTYTINSGGSINLDGKGYSAGNGTGQGVDANGASGAGHGGEGGDSNAAQGGSIYGSLTQPETIGSGGGIDGVGSPGGGSVKLDVTGGTINIIGSITANGTSAASGSSDAGGGSGGSIYLITGTLSGSGTLAVNGGAGGTFGQVAGAGAGGRIALYYTTDSSTITSTAYTGSTNGTTSIYGSSGTIYKEQAGGSKSVLLDNNGRTPNGNYATLPASLSIDTLTVTNGGSYRADTASITATTINLTNSSYLWLSATGAITYTTLNWSTSSSIIDRGGSLALISGGGALTVPATTNLYADTTRSYSSVTVNGTITHSTNTTAKTYYINQTVTGSGNYTINSGGYVSARGKGYAASQGTGQGTDGNGAGGAGYGGEGGNDGFVNTPGGTTYGSITVPTDLGSGGGIDTSGAAGGGAIQLNIGGTLTIAGAMDAEGQTNPGTGSDDAGGGSGGSVYIVTNTITGAGSISVNGTNSYRYGGAGGGGRIALYYTTDTSSITYTAYGGLQGGSGGKIAAAGTIYKEASGGNKVLTIDNGGRDAGIKNTNIATAITLDTLTINNRGYVKPTVAIITSTLNLTNNSIYYNNAATSLTHSAINWASGSVIYDSGGTFTILSGGGDLTVPASTYLYADTERSYSSVTIDGTLTNTTNTTAETYKIVHNVSGNYLINATGVIDLNSKGFNSATGSGKGVDSTSGSGGAGYGGIGGSGSVGAGGTTYGAETTPINIGSGGGQDGAGNGGKGGGAVYLNVNGNVTIYGSINANGGNYVSLDSGGGSGGSIYIRSNVFSGNGNLYAKGGNGNASTGGGGAGGRIAVYFNTNSWSGNTLTPAVATAGGTGRNAGNVGTVYLATYNAVPVATSVTIDSGDLSIDLTENSTTNVVCTATVTDTDGYADIDYVTAQFFRSSIGAGAADNANNHYTLSGDSQCIPANGSGNSEDYTCTFGVYFHADPTDTGSAYESDNWTCLATPYDGDGAGTNDDDTIEINSLRALAVPASLNYGELEQGENTTSDITTVISNTGNSPIDMTLYGYNMCTDYPACTGFTLAVGRQEYAATTFSYGTGTVLTSSAANVEINLIKPTAHPSNATYTMYWAIGIPAGQKNGYYLGENVFTAIPED